MHYQEWTEQLSPDYYHKIMWRRSPHTWLEVCWTVIRCRAVVSWCDGFLWIPRLLSSVDGSYDAWAMRKPGHWARLDVFAADDRRGLNWSVFAIDIIVWYLSNMMPWWPKMMPPVSLEFRRDKRPAKLHSISSNHRHRHEITRCPCWKRSLEVITAHQATTSRLFTVPELKWDRQHHFWSSRHHIT